MYIFDKSCEFDGNRLDTIKRIAKLKAEEPILLIFEQPVSINASIYDSFISLTGKKYEDVLNDVLAETGSIKKLVCAACDLNNEDYPTDDKVVNALPGSINYIMSEIEEMLLTKKCDEHYLSTLLADKQMYIF